MCVGVPGQIVSVTDAENHLAIVQIGGVKREINIACVVDETRSAQACVGEWVLVHVGFAMSRLDELEARATLALLHEFGEATAELEAMQGSAGARA
jgi:hydrogenase expression/formation protein HypC